MAFSPVYFALSAANPGLLGMAFTAGPDTGGYVGSSGRFMNYYVAATGWRLWMCRLAVALGSVLVVLLLMAIIGLGIDAVAFYIMYFSSPWVGVPAAVVPGTLAVALCSGLINLWLRLTM